MALKNPKLVKVDSETPGRVDVEIAAQPRRRFYVSLYASGMVIIGRQVPGNAKRMTHVRDVDAKGPLGRELKQLATKLLDEYNRERMAKLEREDVLQLSDAKAAVPMKPAVVLPGGGLILPPSEPAPPPKYVYLSPQGARNMAEELLRAARNVEAAMALAPDPYQIVEAGCNVRIRVGA